VVSTSNPENCTIRKAQTNGRWGHDIFSSIRTNLRTELPGGGAPLEQLGRVRMFLALVHLRS
jgi:hypothetical protein